MSTTTTTTTITTTTTYPEFSPGQKVRTCYGETRTVLFQNGCQVFVAEEFKGWYHPSKVWPEKAKP
jgi:hypothetical protein